ncbi:MAG: hypothetical protein DRJ37_05120 [Thermoprotei archaeon]|nr:MAG: hypothetical protein DRJ37_05120 [Thermoprotei archaeon]
MGSHHLNIAILVIIVILASLLLTYGESSFLVRRDYILKKGNYAVLESISFTPGSRHVTLFIQQKLNQTHDKFTKVFAEDIILGWKVVEVQDEIAAIEMHVKLINAKIVEGFIYKVYSGGPILEKIISERKTPIFERRGLFKINLETMTIEGTDISWPYMIKKNHINSLKPLKLIDLTPPYYGSDLLPRNESWKTIVIVVNSSKIQIEESPVPNTAESVSNPIYIAWLNLGKPKVLPGIIPKGESIPETLKENTIKVIEESKKYKILFSKLVYDADTGLLVLIKHNHDLLIEQIGYTDYVLKTLFNADRVELWIYNKYIVLKETNILANP